MLSILEYPRILAKEKVMSNKIITVRLPEEQVSDLETIARFDGVALAEVVRAGVELVLESRRADPEFRVRVEKAYAEAQRLLQGVDGADEVLEVVSRPLPVADEQKSPVGSGAGVA
jgi:Arc/MetJ-type ribon-helix-helix transcriptional regulator